MRSKKIVLLLLLAAGLLMPGPVFCEEMQVSVLKIDDFDGKVMFNLLGGKTQGYEEAGIKCIPSFTDDPKERYGDKGASLKLDFDVTKRGSFAFYWTMLTVKKNIEVEGRNVEVISFAALRGHDFLEFQFKDPKGGADFTIEVHEDADGDGVYMMGVDRSSMVNADPYIDRTAAGKWQKISIPLIKFANIKDWDRILEIVFVFKSGYGIPKGTVYLDDLELVKYPKEEPSQ
ncbi:MAG: hypothetical protein PHW51_05750 [Candidatus Omnitrophica bacterium]|nr:hypothetical protein [Candidatus Omnitrophota bacterium]